MKKHAVDFGQRLGKLTAHKLVYIGALAAPPPKGVYICDACATLCYELVEEYLGEEKAEKKNECLIG